MCHISLCISSVDGHLGCFHLPVIVRATMNMDKHLCSKMYSPLLMSMGGMLGWHGRLSPAFWRTTIYLHQSTLPPLVSQFPLSPLHISICCYLWVLFIYLFYPSPSGWVKMKSENGFHLIFMIAKDIEHY